MRAIRGQIRTVCTTCMRNTWTLSGQFSLLECAIQGITLTGFTAYNTEALPVQFSLLACAQYIVLPGQFSLLACAIQELYPDNFLRFRVLNTGYYQNSFHCLHAQYSGITKTVIIACVRNRWALSGQFSLLVCAILGLYPDSFHCFHVQYRGFTLTVFTACVRNTRALPGQFSLLSCAI